LGPAGLRSRLVPTLGRDLKSRPLRAPGLGLQVPTLASPALYSSRPALQGPEGTLLQLSSAAAGSWLPGLPHPRPPKPSPLRLARAGRSPAAPEAARGRPRRRSRPHPEAHSPTVYSRSVAAGGVSLQAAATPSSTERSRAYRARLREMGFSEPTPPSRRRPGAPPCKTPAEGLTLQPAPPCKTPAEGLTLQPAPPLLSGFARRASHPSGRAFGLLRGGGSGPQAPPAPRRSPGLPYPQPTGRPKAPPAPLLAPGLGDQPGAADALSSILLGAVKLSLAAGLPSTEAAKVVGSVFAWVASQAGAGLEEPSQAAGRQEQPRLAPPGPQLDQPSDPAPTPAALEQEPGLSAGPSTSTSWQELRASLRRLVGSARVGQPQPPAKAPTGDPAGSGPSQPPLSAALASRSTAFYPPRPAPTAGPLATWLRNPQAVRSLWPCVRRGGELPGFWRDRQSR
jgi:hypothetical protein